jgi:hypothetical protein
LKGFWAGSMRNEEENTSGMRVSDVVPL